MGFPATEGSGGILPGSSKLPGRCFYDDNKGIVYMEGGMIDFANAFSDEPVENLFEFTYKIEQDSILYRKFKDEQEYKRWAIVRKFSENYDYLQFLIDEEGEDKVFFNLKKIGE